MLVKWKDKGGFYMSSSLITNLNNYVKGVMTKNTSAVYLCDGRSGLGKTTLSCQISCHLANEIVKYKQKKLNKKVEPKFTLDDVCWTPDVFIEKLKKATYGDIIIMDESMILSNRSAMSHFNKAVIIMMSLIRSKQIFVIFNVNSIFDLDKNLVLHRADVLFHLYAEDDRFASRGRYLVIPSAHGKLKNLYIVGKKYYNYSKARIAFRDKYTKFFPFDEKEYEKKKQDAIQKYFTSSKPETSTVRRIKETRDKVIRYLKDVDKLKPQQIADICGLSTRQIWKCLQKDG